METVNVTPWPHGREPDQSELRQCFADEGLVPYRWSNGPHDVYAAHRHSYHKVIYVVRGSITFGLPQMDAEVTLKAGDRLDLPAGVVHTAVVGANGVVCLEGHRS